MSEELITIANDALEIGVCPDLGGSLAFFRTKGNQLFDIFHPASPTTLKKKDIFHMAMFAMLPYTHRIEGGRFTYWGITRMVPKNHSGYPCPIHGDGWKAKWTVETKTSNHIELAYTHKKDDGYPFNYEARLRYTLSDTTLNAEIELKNTGALPMPCGIGLHPLFTRTPNARLIFQNTTVWHHDTDPIDKPYKTPKSLSFSEGRDLKDEFFDTCFGGFDGKAYLQFPKYGIGVEVKTTDNFIHSTLYAPQKKGYFALEPSTMTTDAFNKASRGIIGTGIQSIGKDETLRGTISFSVEKMMKK